MSDLLVRKGSLSGIGSPSMLKTPTMSRTLGLINLDPLGNSTTLMMITRLNKNPTDVHIALKSCFC